MTDLLISMTQHSHMNESEFAMDELHQLSFQLICGMSSLI